MLKSMINPDLSGKTRPFKIIFLLLGISLFISSIVFAGPNENAGIVFDLDAITYGNQNLTNIPSQPAGTYIRLDVYCTGVQNLDTYEFEVIYDPTELAYVAASAANLITFEPNILTTNGGTAIGWMINSSTPGVLSIAYTLAYTDTLEAPEGEGLIADIVFQALVATHGTLSFGDVHFYDSFGVMDIITDKGIAILYEFGNIDGTVTDANNGEPIEDALITATSQGKFEYTGFTNADGYYIIDSLIAVIAGNYTVICDAADQGYNIAYAYNVEIIVDDTTNVDFALTSPIMVVDPLEIFPIVENIGDSTITDITLSNIGTGPLDWHGTIVAPEQLREPLKIEFPTPPAVIAPDHAEPSLGLAPEIIHTNNNSEPVVNLTRGSTGWAYDISHDYYYSFDTDTPQTANVIGYANWYAFAGDFDSGSDDDATYYIIKYPNNIFACVDIETGIATDIGSIIGSDGYTWTGISCDKSTGIMYAVESDINNTNLWTIDLATGAPTLIGATGIPCVIDIAVDGEGILWGQDIIYDNMYTIDPTTAVGTLVGPTDFSANYAQGMSWDPETDQVYLTAYSTLGEFRVLDRETGYCAYVGPLPGNDEVCALGFIGGDMPPWIKVEPISGTIEPGGDEIVQATVYWLDEFFPGQLEYADIVFSPAPDCGEQTVNVTATFGPPPEYGALQGTVTDGYGEPLEGATITALGDLPPSGPYCVTTNDSGYYEIDPIIGQFYNFTCEAEGFITFTDTFTVLPGETYVEDVIMCNPEIRVEPDSHEVTLAPETQTTRLITVYNDGNAPLSWTADIQFPDRQVINIPPATTDFPRSEDKLSLSLAPQNGEPINSSTTPMINPLRGTTAYAFNVSPGSDLVTFDTDAPETWLTTIPMTYSPFAADFDINGNFYAVDYDTENLYAVDIETGVFTFIGPTQKFLDLACDKTDGTMYASYYESGNSYLYTIDLTTGSATLIGLINAGGIISMACDGEGNLWGFDIIDDALYAIDKDDGHGTYVGSVGFDGSYAQSMAWDPESDIVYMAAYNNTVGAGQLRIVDTSTGATALVGTFNGGAEVAGLGFQGGIWLNIDPTSGYVLPGEYEEVTATFDATHQTVGTVLTANIHFIPNVGNEDTVFVELIVGSPITGTLDGYVKKASDLTLIEGAVVTATSVGDVEYQDTTNSDGYYIIPEIWEDTYNVSCFAAGYNIATQTAVIVGDETTTVNFSLTQPTMDITPTSISETVSPSTPIEADIHIVNNGDGELVWDASIELNRGVETDYSNCTTGILEAKNGQANGGNGSNGFVAEENLKDDVTLHYDGPNDDGIGLNSGGTFMVAARFTPTELGDYYGDYQLSNVEIFIYDMPTSATLKVWEGGSMGDPGTEIYSEDITGQISQESWATIILSAPIDLVSGNEYWVGYEVTHNAGLYPAGCDAGPAVDEKGDWIYLASGPWDELQNIAPTLDYNWNIRAVLSLGITPWITLTHNSGIVAAGGDSTVTVYFNTIDHTIGEILQATIDFVSTPDVGTDTVHVTVTVEGGIIGDFNSDGYVDAADFLLFGDHWHFIDSDPGWDAIYNLDTTPDPVTGLQIIDAADFQVFGDHWHEGTPPKSITCGKSGKGPNEDAGIRFDLNATTYGNQNQTSMDPPSIDDYIRVDVYAINVHNLDTYEFEVNYNPNQLEYITTTSTNPITYEENILTSNGGEALGPLIDTSTPGVLSISMTLTGTDTTEAPEGEGLVADIVFQVLTTEQDSLTFGNVYFYDSFGVMDVITYKGTAYLPVDDIGFDTIFKENRLENYPNPFRAHTTISYAIKGRKKTDEVEIRIYNLRGQLIESIQATNGTACLNTEHYSSGIYFYKVSCEDERITSKMLIIR